MRRPALPLRHSFGLLRLLLATTFATAGCYSAGDGQTPPEDRVYFPVGLALANQSKHLLVANSDFDLQYNAGTLNVLDLGVLPPLVTVPCASDADCASASARCREESGDAACDSHPICNPTLGLCSAAADTDEVCGPLARRELKAQLLSPGACDYIDPAHPPVGGALLRSEVQIGAFATDVIYRERPEDRREPYGDGDTLVGRAFVPVRGDATLHWIEVSADGALECGQLNGAGCDDLHRAGNHKEENSRDLRLAPEPFAVAATPDATAVLVTNQTTGTVSLFQNDWSPSVGAELKFAVTGLPLRPAGIAALPKPAYASTLGGYYPPGFLVTFRNAPEVDLVRYYDDSNTTRTNVEGTPVPRPYAARTGVSGIRINSVGTDSRGIAVDASARSDAEQLCLQTARLSPSCLGSSTCLASLTAEQQRDLAECLNRASATPLDVFVANRAPATLLLGRTTPSMNALENTELPNFYDSVPLTLGPSRVVVGNVVVGLDAQGNKVFERRVFVVCFDSRRIFVYDPIARRMDAEIVTGRGPHALAVDEQHGWMFVGHFTDSFIGVVSLDRRFPKTYGTTLAIIGKPTPPRASK